MKKALSYITIVSLYFGYASAQVNINSTTNLQNGNNSNDALTVTNQYTGTNIDRIGIKGLSLQAPNWGIGGEFKGGYIGVHGTATMNGGGGRGGFFEAANLPAGGNQYGALCWSYNSSAVKYGVFGGAWGGNGMNYGVCGQTVGTGYGVYCLGNGACTGIWTSASDQKLKTNVQPLGSVLDKVKQLQTVTFNYDSTKYPSMGFDTRKKIGVIAQNVETVFPELVKDEVCPGITLPPDGKTGKATAAAQPVQYKGVDYNGLIPVLVSAIQEQQKEIEDLKAKIK